MRGRRVLQARLTALYAVPFLLAVVAGIGLFSYGSASSAPVGPGSPARHPNHLSATTRCCASSW
ncbi:hypothetical protein [Dactylosporangium cerinum]